MSVSEGLGTHVAREGSDVRVEVRAQVTLQRKGATAFLTAELLVGAVNGGHVFLQPAKVRNVFGKPEQTRLFKRAVWEQETGSQMLIEILKRVE